ncbi:hypothetical protein ABW19_dt0202355 [Dactylella cylindrospora]|nr:hypothetical protein ABW19_dt0202355 [Dactylella cylindrospora]
MGKEPGLRSNCFQNVLLLLAEAFPKQSDQGESMTDLWPQCDQYASSLLALSTAYNEANPPFAPSETDEHFARLLYDGSWYLWEKRFFQQAKEVAELAEKVILKVNEKSLLYSDILTVIAVVNLESSRYHQGLAHFRHALAVVEAYLQTVETPGRKEMVHLANASNNVATGLLTMGPSALGETEKMLDKAGRLKSKWTSEENEPSLFTEHYCNMGRLKCLQGHMEEAITLSRKAVDLNRQVYKNTNMSRTTSFMDNLAYVLKAAGRHEEASQTHHQNFEWRIQYLGEQIQDTALSYHFLAVEYLGKGDLITAR